jgi:hypothetical protein
LKEQNKILRFAKLIAEKESSDYSHASEKAKIKRTKETEAYSYSTIMLIIRSI